MLVNDPFVKAMATEKQKNPNTTVAHAVDHNAGTEAATEQSKIPDDNMEKSPSGQIDVKFFERGMSAAISSRTIQAWLQKLAGFLNPIPVMATGTF